MFPCKNLDYTEGKYVDCKIVDLYGFSCPVKHWVRGESWTEGGNPKNVQFCKSRGRINGIFNCYNPGEMPCYETDHDERVDKGGK